MASVSGSNSSYSSLSSQIRGYGGLASGLDRDTLIEQMTSGTRAKIAKQGQQKTKLEWQFCQHSLCNGDNISLGVCRNGGCIGFAVLYRA